MATKHQQQINDWLVDPTTIWFMYKIKERFGNVNTDWRHVKTIEELYKLKGNAEVVDLMQSLIKDPDSYV